MKSNLFFIIGIRRSGTSILRELIMKHPQVMGCEFEPHDLWAAVDLNHFPRLMKKRRVNYFSTDTIGEFYNNGLEAATKNQWYGAKFALNPGVKALEWVWLKKTFPNARFIFINRNTNSTWNSYVKQDKDSVRGLITKEAYFAECNNLLEGYQGHFLNYKSLLNNANWEMELVFKSLGLDMPPINFQQFIKKPEF